MNEALVAMFAEDYDDMLEKTAKKRTARERLEKQLEENRDPIKSQKHKLQTTS